MTKPLFRFAPSPTGLLHVGNARMALVNWLMATANGGSMLLRLDDTDQERSKPEYADAIRRDLAWLGITWSAEYRQLDRVAHYAAAVEKLKEAGRLYACYETPEELEYKRRRQMKAGKPPIYDRAGLTLSEADRAAQEAEGRQPHWRFKLEHAAIEWADLVRGSVHFEGDKLSDPILVRGDGTYLYHLPSCVDDLELCVTHIVRGEDHVANTAVHVQILQALGGHPPIFAHVPLLTDLHGGGLSKRLGSLTLESLRDAGCEPLALASYLTTLGSGGGGEPAASMDELAHAFDVDHAGRAQPKFDPDQLWAENAKVLHAMPFEVAAARLEELGLAGATATFWEAVRANLEKFDDVMTWHAVCFGDTAPVVDDADFAAEAASLLPPSPWDETTWSSWTAAVKEATGRKGKDLFQPLRRALTGLDHGPELKRLLPLIGREKTLARLLNEED